MVGIRGCAGCWEGECQLWGRVTSSMTPGDTRVNWQPTNTGCVCEYIAHSLLLPIGAQSAAVMHRESVFLKKKLDLFIIWCIIYQTHFDVWIAQQLFVMTCSLNIHYFSCVTGHLNHMVLFPIPGWMTRIQGAFRGWPCDTANENTPTNLWSWEYL